MLDFTDKLMPWKKEFPNYALHLVSSDTVDARNFKTGLREVFELLKVCHDRKLLNKVLKENKNHYSHLSRERTELVSIFLDIPVLREKQNEGEEGAVNMCTAIEEMVRDGEQRGEKRGEQRGEKRGEQRSLQLVRRLLEKNRIEDILRMTEDEEFRKQLFHEDGL